MASVHIDSSTGNAVSITEAQLANVPSMAQCHIGCFPDQFTSHMGTRFAEAFYKAYLVRNDGLAFVAIEQESNKVVGLIVGGHPDIRPEFLREAPRRFLGTLLFKCLVDRPVRIKLIKYLAQRLRHSGISDNTDDAFRNCLSEAVKNIALMQVICVLDKYRGTGVAKSLMEAFQCACQQVGYYTLNLNVGSNNARAIAFYRKLGWKIIAEKPNAIRMQVVIRDCHG